MKKHNVTKKKHENSMIAVALKVREWNANGKNYCLFFTQQDHDAKYHNAWVKVMGTSPRRLLCSWHIIKNWVIQGRSKIRNEEIKKTMKADLKRILNETNEEKFVELTEKYFERQQNADEHVFLNYLKKYYYQSEERIAMWAHC